MNYDAHFCNRLEDLHTEGRYRVFAERTVGRFPRAMLDCERRKKGVVIVLFFCDQLSFSEVRLAD
jgi:5-aminolevulinate synthase